MSPLDKLTQLFTQFPGVGARQAKRFAFHVLTLPEAERTELSELTKHISQNVIECTSCRRFFARPASAATICNICSDPNRDTSKLMVVEQDSDITAMERAGVYDGLYFVLGGTLPLLEKKQSNTLRGNGLTHIVTERIPAGLQEIILAFAVNPDGENTSRYVASLLKDTLTEHAITLTYLGRGLSTGSELEYADPDTLKHAWTGRQ